MSRVKLALAMGALLLLGCSCRGCAGGPVSMDAAPAPAAAYPEPAVAQILADVDARVLSQRLRAARHSTDAELRYAAFLGLGRLRTPEAALLLRGGLSDPAARVRGVAARELGRMERAPDGLGRWLLLTLATEDDVEVRSALLEALGTADLASAQEAVVAGLRADTPEEQAGSCRAISAAARRGRVPTAAVVAALLALADREPGPDVMVPCTDALGRLGPSAEGRPRVEAALTRLAASANVDVRRMAYRGLSRLGMGSLEQLLVGTRDPAWTVSVAAMRALGRRAGGDVGRACAELVTELAATDWEASGAIALHRLRGLSASCAPHAKEEALYRASVGALERVAASAGAAGRERGAAHCVLAELVDRGRGWPNRSPTCGLGLVDGSVQGAAAARVIGEAEGADAARRRYLERLSVDADVRTREAVVRAAAKLSGQEGAAIVLGALESGDTGLVCTALEVLLERSSAWSRGEQAGLSRIGHDRLEASLRQAYGTLLAADHLEGLGLYADLLGRVAVPELDETVGSLTQHWNWAVRSRARSVAHSLGMEVGEGHDPVPDPQAPALGTSVVRVRFTTARGDFVVETRPAAAPVTTARFVSLVRSRFYDGTSFHRVVPGFVVQGGDPRGDGYGGPDFSLRCEDNGLRYERGAVGVALAGRDTGGSQFFITYGAEPSLDGRYTIFGQVVEGMEIVDRLQPRDAIVAARAE